MLKQLLSMSNIYLAHIPDFWPFSPTHYQHELLLQKPLAFSIHRLALGESVESRCQFSSQSLDHNYLV